MSYRRKSTRSTVLPSQTEYPSIYQLFSNKEYILICYFHFMMLLPGIRKLRQTSGVSPWRKYLSNPKDVCHWSFIWNACNQDDVFPTLFHLHRQVVVETKSTRSTATAAGKWKWQESQGHREGNSWQGNRFSALLPSSKLHVIIAIRYVHEEHDTGNFFPQPDDWTFRWLRLEIWVRWWRCTRNRYKNGEPAEEATAV